MVNACYAYLLKWYCGMVFNEKCVMIMIIII